MEIPIGLASHHLQVRVPYTDAWCIFKLVHHCSVSDLLPILHANYIHVYKRRRIAYGLLQQLWRDLIQNVDISLYETHWEVPFGKWPPFSKLQRASSNNWSANTSTYFHMQWIPMLGKLTGLNLLTQIEMILKAITQFPSCTPVVAEKENR